MDINKAFLETSRLIFGREIGQLEEFAPYFEDALVGRKVKSTYSKKDLFVTSTNYPPAARFFDFEMEHAKVNALSKPFDINKIKDIDSLLDELRERFVYCGGKVLGNSSNISKSDCVSDSSYVLDSTQVHDSKYVAYGYLIRNSEFSFGASSFGFSSNVIRCHYGYEMRRTFECACVGTISDCMFCYNVFSSSNCLFCFNVYSRQNMVGNIQLGKGEYSALKEKLVGEIAQDLQKKKRLDYSILGLV